MFWSKYNQEEEKQKQENFFIEIDKTIINLKAFSGFFKNNNNNNNEENFVIT